MLAFVANLKDMFAYYDVCEYKAICVLGNLLNSGVKERYGTYTDKEKRTDGYVYPGTFPVVIKSHIQHFSIKNVLQGAYNLETQSFAVAKRRKSGVGDPIF